MRLSRFGLRRSCRETQGQPGHAARPCRSAPGRSGQPPRRSCSASFSGSLNEIGTVMMRPSNSGQGDVHGRVERVEAALRRLPLPACRAAADRLQDRHAESREDAHRWSSGFSRSSRLGRPAKAGIQPGVGRSACTSPRAKDTVATSTSISGWPSATNSEKAAGQCSAGISSGGEASSFSEAVKTGKTLAPRASSARTKHR